MKATYQRPNVKVSLIDTEDLLAASPTIGGDTGIGIGEGDPPSTGNAKQNRDEGSSGNNSWKD